MSLTMPHRIDRIIDFNGTNTPKGGSALSQGRIAMRKRAPNTELTVSVNNLFMSVMLNAFCTLDKEFGQVMRGANSMEQAEQIIQRDRAKSAVAVAH